MEKQLAGLSVLVVDDEAMLRRRLGAHLEALGADITGVETLEAARNQISAFEFDFVLLDINLPDGSGLDLLRTGTISPATGVVVMTAEGGVETAVEAMRLGALDYLTKPLGGIFGGSISAILVGIPGTGAAINAGGRA